MAAIALSFMATRAEESEKPENNDDSKDLEANISPTGEVDFRTDIPDFVPTHEWREVLDGQAVPGGLNIRFDFAEGKKYAKLIEGQTAPSDVPDSGSRQQALDLTLPPEKPASDEPVSMDDAISKILHDEEKAAFTVPEPIRNLTPSLKNMLLELPEPDPEIVEGFSKKLSEEQMEKIYRKVWQKRQQMIADAFSKIRNEATEMKKMLRRILERRGAVIIDTDESEKQELDTKLPSTEELLDILEELQISVEDLDHAGDFHKLGGFAIMVDLLSEEPDPHADQTSSFDSNALKGHAAWVLGTAIKNQDHLQNAALKTGAMRPLLQLVQNLDKNPKGAAKGMYGLGALIRHQTEAQQEFLRLDGVTVLMELLNGAFFSKKASHKTLRWRLKTGQKAVSLIEDLFIDQTNQQVIQALSSEPCCNRMAKIFSQCENDVLRDKTLRALNAVRSRCGPVWISSGTKSVLINSLQQQVQKWVKEAASDDDNDYVLELKRNAENLIGKLSS